MNNIISERPRVALLGLGTMGLGMAGRLLGAGFKLAVFNRTAQKAEPLAAKGAQIAATPRKAATGADVIVSMVADDAVSRSLWLGKGGALSNVSPGAILIESSTVTTSWINELAEAAREKGAELLDAPVTGSRTQAASGELNFLVGGSEAALEKARPLFAVMGRSATHVGPTGSGALLKLINNFLCGVQAVSLAEALAVIENAGLDGDVATQILMNGAPGSPLLKTLSQRMTARDYTPHFHLSLMRKDLEYSLKEAKRRGVNLSTAQSALEAFERAVASGRGMQDVSAVVEPLRERTR